MFNDTWVAILSDGRQFNEDSPELEGERSPWRALEALCKDEGVTIAQASASIAGLEVSLEAEDQPLVCGQAVDWEMGLGGEGFQSMRYRWVCREGTKAWLWRLTDGFKAWEIETTPGIPGQESMPSPPKEASV